MLESTRQKEAEVKKQTSEQLELFRRQQEEADKAAIDVGGEAQEGEGANGKEEEEKWVVNKGKRKREEKKGLKGFKLRKASSSVHDGEGFDKGAQSPPRTLPGVQPQSKTIVSPIIATSAACSPSQVTQPLAPAPKATQTVPAGLGLAGYSSDEED